MQDSSEDHESTSCAYEDQVVRQPDRDRDSSLSKRCLISEINSTVYVGRFGSSITDDDLRATFETYGDVDAARVVYQPSLNDMPKISRGYGFVRFAREEDAQKAAQALNGKELFGRSVRVEISRRDTPREPTPGRFLGVSKDEPARRRRSRSRSSSRSRSRDRRRRRRRSPSSRSRSRSRRKDRKHRRSRDRRSKDRSRDRSGGRSKDRSRSRGNSSDSSKSPRKK